MVELAINRFCSFVSLITALDISVISFVTAPICTSFGLMRVLFFIAFCFGSLFITHCNISDKSSRESFFRNRLA